MAKRVRSNGGQALKVPVKCNGNPIKFAAYIHKQAVRIFRRNRQSTGDIGGWSVFHLPDGSVISARPDRAIDEIEEALGTILAEQNPPSPSMTLSQA